MTSEQVATGRLALVTRGDLVESEHSGHLAVARPDGSVLVAVGSLDAPIWARSSLKPLQAVAMLRAGLRIDDAGLALACASHSGTGRHLAVVRAVLGAAGLDESALQNTPDLPLDAQEAAVLLAAGGASSALTQNCSGKHAAMLATCRVAGWDVETYLRADHPLQHAVRAAVAELTGEPVRHVTVDGCGAPLLSTTTLGLARAFGRIAAAPTSAPGSAEARVALAMATHPDLVGGPGRDVTSFMTAVPGLVAKDGAEGVYAAGLRDGTGIAFKVADGAARPRAAVLAGALAAVAAAGLGGGALGDVVLDAVREIGRTPVLGHGRPVGEVLAVVGVDAGTPAADRPIAQRTTS